MLLVTIYFICVKLHERFVEVTGTITFSGSSPGKRKARV